MKLNHQSITFPRGFKASAGHTGIKRKSMDMALIISEAPAVSAGCFTLNTVKAAPVKWDIDAVKNSPFAKGIVVNSGNANACTGAQGDKDCKKMAETLAGLEGCGPEEILVCSTGIIGVKLPMDKIITGIKDLHKGLDSSMESGSMAAKGIMTTDTYEKTAGCEISLSGKAVKIGAMAKGSGMIHPNMATMLGFITTDANISKALLQNALSDVIEKTFNMITVDGDTSTNDTVLIMANGLAENTLIEEKNEDYELFTSALLEVCKKLAMDIARDGEGATKLMEITVTGAKAYNDAREISKSIAGSSLFKAALFGADANWGRVLCAMGYSGGFFTPENVGLTFHSLSGGIKKEIILMKDGAPVSFNEEEAKEVLKEKEIFINIYLKDGNASAKAWGCDLSYDYVKINGDYRS